MVTENTQQQSDFDQVKNALIADLRTLRLDASRHSPMDRVKIFNENVLNVETNVSENFNRPLDVSFLKSINEEIKIINTVLHDEANETYKMSKDRKIALLSDRVKAINDEITDYNSINLKFSKLTFEAISESLGQVKEELMKFNRLRNIADNARTEQIYNNAVKKYRINEWAYRILFISTLITAIVFSNNLLHNKKQIMIDYAISGNEFWIFKASIVLIGVTLISYFLKQSAHYQRLADQNYQTQVELQAYPSFMESVPTNEAASIRKELALKYFGRDLDSSPHKDMSNLVSDQMKSTTELVKASAEVVKGFKQPAVKITEPSKDKGTN